MAEKYGHTEKEIDGIWLMEKESEEVLNSHYWYAFLGKEVSKIFYVLFLNQEHFTKDDVIRMAQQRGREKSSGRK